MARAFPDVPDYQLGIVRVDLRLEFVEQCDQVLQVPAEPVQTPHYQHVEASAPGIGHKAIERRPPIRRAANAVDVFDSVPAASLCVAAQLRKLVLRFLVECADTGVDCGAHGEPVHVG
jgi:hypothetical protein